MEQEKLGIVNITKAVVAAINLAEKIDSKLDDGKLSLMEALGVGISSFADIVKVIRSGAQLKAEYKDLDPEERETLIKIVRNEFDLKNDRVEDVIEKAFEFLVNLDYLIASLKR